MAARSECTSLPDDVVPPNSSAYVEVKLESWSEFANKVNALADRPDEYVWRGQADRAWKLESTLQRLKPDYASDEQWTRYHLTGFKRASAGRIPGLSIEAEENRWWAAGRHAGLATPLLDWTMSPYVAAFFAFRDAAGQSIAGERAIYRLAWMTLLQDGAKLADANAKPGDFDKLQGCLSFIFPLAKDNPPMAAQSGLFTRLYPPDADIESWVKRHYKGCELATLTKYILPGSDGKTALSCLRMMNIHPASLFPSTEGSAEYSNLWLKHGLYARWLEKMLPTEQLTIVPPNTGA